MILGRQPALGIAELESLYGSGKIQPVGTQAAVVDVDPCLLAFNRLGGSVKFTKLLTILDTTKWDQVEKFLIQVSPDHSRMMPEGKMTIGLSLYDFNESIKRIESTGLNIKKAVRKTGRSVRLVPNKATELNSAQVHHNKLTNPNGWELVFVKHGDKTYVGQTVKVQDIEAYTARDRERPMRDTKVGMLPPKLAQILINLGSGEIPESKLSNICDIPADQPIPAPILDQTVLDPFCGTGVVLQEALLMGYGAHGSDLEQRMVDYSQGNLKWLTDSYLPRAMSKSVQNERNCTYSLEVGDATKHQWDQECDFVAAETYLGRPFNSLPDSQTLAQTMTDSNLIIKKFLKNIGEQIKPGTRLALAVPAWQIRPNQFKYLPLIDSLSDLGYNRVSFEHAGDQDLIYYRSDQVVARKLIVITRK
jgi:tRNA G10  N-methylase Trm11